MGALSCKFKTSVGSRGKTGWIGKINVNVNGTSLMRLGKWVRYCFSHGNNVLAPDVPLVKIVPLYSKEGSLLGFAPMINNQEVSHN